MTTHRIAVIPGDGIGKEVMPEGIRCVDAVARKHGIRFDWQWFDFSSYDYYAKYGSMLPPDWFDTLRQYEAIYFGAVGWPQGLPDHEALWGSLMLFRRSFDQYVNMRPVKTMPGLNSPLAGRGPGDIDFLIIRENTEGEYSDIGGIMFEGTEREFVVQNSIMTRKGVDRIIRYAFEKAKSREKLQVTSATKSNGIAITMPYWDKRFKDISTEYPGVSTNQFHIDILTAHFVQRPDRFDVVVASNLFGDILSDLGPACAGTIGIAPSASINPEGVYPSLFEPVHGSAPDIAGKGIANPIGQIWSGALMLDHLGYPEASAEIVSAFEKVLAAGPQHAPLTRDMGGTGSTIDLGRAVAEVIEASSR